jgi:3-oxoacyl-[acyl-carrier-protein] synthase-3
MPAPSVPGHIRSLAVAFPREVRTNAWWEERYPQLVANEREATLAKVWASFGGRSRDGGPAPAGAGTSIYDEAIARYLEDPFRGTVERRVMSEGMTAKDLSLAAARAALSAGGYGRGDIDLVLVHALRPDHHVVGDAAFTVRDLGLRAPAINFESACSSAVVGFHLASDLVQAGRYRSILVIVCSTYTRDVDPADSFSWFLGDGAAAFVVERAKPGHGLLGACTIPTIETCGAFAYELEMVEGKPGLRMRPNSAIAGKSIRDASEGYLRRASEGALREAGAKLGDVDFLICNTPTAWYAELCTRALGLDESRTVDNYPRHANCGPVLWPSNLYTAINERRVAPGDLVLGYSVGSVSTASAVVFRLDEIAIASVEV